MHFLFISTFLGPVGGIEIQISRMSKWLINRGHSVTLLTNSVCENRELFPEKMRIVDLGEKLEGLCFWNKGRRVWTDAQLQRPDIIKSFDLTASWIASVISSGIKPTPKILFGNYFPYVIPRSRNILKNLTFRLFLLNIAKNYNDDSILCMSEEHISDYRRNYGYHRKPKFWPLPIEDISKDSPVRTPEWGRIVSVGRLAPMKEYNIYMIDVVARLRQKGYPVTWSVYGEGELAEIMKRRINDLDLGEAVELKGRLLNSNFAAAMQKAYIYVGMGATIIEAALCGVPGVVALAHDTSGVTYGPLYKLRFGNVGELMDEPPKSNVESEIERLLTLREYEYEEEIKITREYAKAYDIDSSMQKFLEIAANAGEAKVSYALFYWYYVHSFLGRLRNKTKVN
jgi:hypothetical protein